MSANNLGGPYNGFSGKQSISNYNNDGDVNTRRELRKSWNTAYTGATYNNYKRRIGPFRAVTNSGDYLSRTAYVCGGPNPANNTHARASRPLGLGGIINACDSTNVTASS